MRINYLKSIKISFKKINLKIKDQYQDNKLKLIRFKKQILLKKILMIQN